ncbi:hypothetical protein [Yoonia sp. MH D7]
MQEGIQDYPQSFRHNFARFIIYQKFNLKLDPIGIGPMKLLGKLSIALCFGITAHSAHALEHEVFITKKGYFPEAIYVSTNFTGVDDTITFHNISGKSARLRYYSNNNWVDVFPWTSNNQSRTITLTTALRNYYKSTLKVPQMSSGSVYQTMALRNELPPLSCPDSRAFCDPYFSNGSANP